MFTRNISIFVTTILLCMFLSVKNSSAAVYEFVPSDNDMFDLDHYYYYTWGFNWSPQANEVIVGAKIFIDNINNWAQEENDKLFIHLLDTVQTGLTSTYDNQGGGDNFNSWGSAQTPLDTFTDLNDSPGPSEDYTYLFSQSELDAFNQYVKDGNFGLGFDPDCHYFNDGVKFTFKTQIVPEPSTILLLTSGLLGGLRLTRRKIYTT